MLAQKEEELTILMKQYYAYDINQLKEEMAMLCRQQTNSLESQTDKDISSLNDLFGKLSKLSAQHMQKQKYVVQTGEDEAPNDHLLALFDEQSLKYQEMIGQANEEKQKLRKEISELEQEVREHRDVVADL